MGWITLRSVPMGRMVAVALAVSACHAEDPVAVETPYVTLRTTETTVFAGATIGVEIVNHSAFTLGFNACHSAFIDRLTTRGWRSAQQEGRNCPDIQNGVMAGQVRTVHVPIPDGQVAGTYRVRFERMYVTRQFGDNDGLVPRSQLTTNTFVVK